MRKKFLSLVLSACMVLTLLPTVALAANTTDTFGDFLVTYDASGTAPTFDDSSHTLTFSAAGEYTVGMKDGTSSTTDRIVINASGAVTLKLNGVVINALNGDSAVTDGSTALTVTGGTVTLNVMADSSLKGGLGIPSIMDGGKGGAGISGAITVTGTATLTVTGGAGGATEGATGGEGGAGIIGNVTVSGAATLIATGGAGGATEWGTGGEGGAGIIGNVTVFGAAALTATGGAGETGNSGIGRAGAGIQGNVNVSGTATLTAVSGSGAATIAISNTARSGGGEITVGEGYTAAAGTDAASAAALPGDSPYTTTAQYVAITPPAPQAKWGLANDGAAPSSWAGSGTLDDAMTYANGLSSGAAYIQLQSDTNTTATLMFSGAKTTILDLNGKTIDAKNGTFSVLTVNGNLTLCDSSTTTVANQGKITGGTGLSGYGGGVYIESTGTFTMTGGNITGNTSGTSGGGVYGNSTGNVMTMTGGSITGNHTQYNGGGVFIQTGGFTVGGTAKITGNTSGTAPNTLPNNVCLYGSMSPPSQQILTISTATPLTTGASIGVRTTFVPSASSPLDFTGANSADYSGYFTSDNSSYVVQNSGTDNAQVVQLAVPVTQAPTVTAVSPTSGSTAGGTAVTITGTNLSNATAVKFGSASATSFTVTSSTFITATAPAGTGTVNITVTTAGGTSAAITADQFTYVSTAAEYAADAAPGTDYVLDDTVTPHTLTIKTAKGAAFWSASGTAYLDYTVKLAADIDVSDFLWTPVGNGSGDAFTGSSDGQGHSISGLTITAANNACVGLFGGTVGATIQNLCVSGTIEVTEADSSLYMGGIVGVMGDDSTIRNCCSHVAIRGAASGGDEVNAGGIVGLLNSGTIENCFSTGDVSATGADLVIAGGIYGAISTYNGDIGIVKNSYNTGSVSGSGSLITFLGALGGAVDRKIVLENCYYLSGAASAAFGSGSSANVGIFTADTADTLTLLANLHSWVSEQASTAYRTWQADNAGSPVNDGYPVFGELWGTTTPVFDNCFGTVTTEKNTDPDAGNEEYHYTFSSWYTAPNGEGTRLGDTDPGAIGTRYYAKWIKNEKTVRTTALDLRDIGESKTYGAVKNGDVYTNADEGWTWYAASTTVNGAAYAANTLVLSGLTVHTAASTALSVPAGTTVVLTEGTANVLYSGYTSTNDEDAYTYGLYGAGDLNLRGGGSLNAVAGRAENIAKNHGCNSSGIYSEDTLTVSDAVTVTARGGIAAGGGEGSSSTGIFGKKAITIAGGTVTAAGSSADVSFGIYCGYDENSSVSGTVVITGGTVRANPVPARSLESAARRRGRACRENTVRSHHLHPPMPLNPPQPCRAPQGAGYL